MSKDVTRRSEFDTRVKEWKGMNRSTDINRKKASEFYDKEIFPTVQERFGKAYKPEKEYGGLILTVGFSPQPLILSICAIRPKRIGLLYTPETEHLCNGIKEATNYSCNADCREIDGSDPNGIYETIWELRFSENWQNFEDIAVDITGGKNAMAAGAGLAASVIPADIYYVDSDNYLPDFRMPEPGSEYLKLLVSPFESTAYGKWKSSLRNS